MRTWCPLFLLAFAFVADASHGQRRAHEIMVYGKEHPLNTRDRLNTRFHTVGTHRGSTPGLIRYTSISSGQECVIRRFIKQLPPVTRCEIITRKLCNQEQVLLYKPVVEDCEKNAEYCQTFYRQQNMDSKTVLCQKSNEVVCTNTSTAITEENEVCHDNHVAICVKMPDTVTLTEKRQKCNGDLTERTTKMCVTYTNGTWSCKNFTTAYDVCDEIHVTKVISVEAVHDKLECADREMPPICHPAHCWLKSNETNCIQGSIPTQLDLKEVVCEKCVQGRTKVRPTLEEKEVCRNLTENYCINVTNTDVVWRKWCVENDKKITSVPAVITPNNNSVETRFPVRVEVTPGEWVDAQDQSELDHFLAMQQRNEDSQLPSLTTRTQHEFQQNGRDTEVIMDTTSQSSKGFLERIKACTKNPTTCKFTFR